MAELRVGHPPNGACLREEVAVPGMVQAGALEVLVLGPGEEPLWEQYQTEWVVGMKAEAHRSQVT